MLDRGEYDRVYDTGYYYGDIMNFQKLYVKILVFSVVFKLGVMFFYLYICLVLKNSFGIVVFLIFNNFKESFFRLDIFVFNSLEIFIFVEKYLV